ncbi:MAG: alpha-glucosidase [Ruminococcus sp.]|nr:alpha-glucosidase [Ruminococcus sp.]
MIRKWSFSPYIDTKAVVKNVPCEDSPLPYFEHQNGCYTFRMQEHTRVYGLGEQLRGVNKRGWVYESYCSDEPVHTEEKRSLYGAHNFILIDSGKDERFLAFFDYPARIRFDIGYTDPDVLTVTPENDRLDLYIIEGDTKKEIIREFRSLIGRSYLPPFFAFGYGQSRWGYVKEEDIKEVVSRHREAGIPLDTVYLDIDYMEDFQDFTVNKVRFPDLKSLSAELKEQGIRLIPIIDAAVKVREGYFVYDEGKKKEYFCKDENGEEFVTAVWPGRSVLPDFLSEDASRWFGENYRILTDMGIEGFWNDMNEPALFYSDKGLKTAFENIKSFEGKNLEVFDYFNVRGMFPALSNSKEDYNAFYHRTDEGVFNHNDVHNLYGYNMTRSAANALKEIRGQRSLLFSRASYIGAHRYGGVWTGDNHAWWSHILQSIRQMPSLNMCGFLYSGSDIGGFGGDCTRDLLLRWLSFAIFTPLMRNHSAVGTRRQEAFSFGDTEEFRDIIALRYRLIPYIYSEFMKAALKDEMYFSPLSFVFEDDALCEEIEDQLMVGEGMMIAPVYTQNVSGRVVYLPEDMTMVRMHNGNISIGELKQGHHYIPIPLCDVVFFIRKGYAIPLCDPSDCTEKLDYATIRLIGTGDSYELYRDDGVSLKASLDNTVNLKKKPLGSL